MKKIIIYYISTISFLIFGNNAFGSSYLNELQTGDFDAFQKKGRVEIAIKLSENLDRLSAYIPSVQPDDIKWHEEELQAIRELRSIDSSAADKRIVDLSYNLIHQKRKIKNQIKNLQLKRKFYVGQSLPIIYQIALGMNQFQFLSEMVLFPKNRYLNLE